MGKVAYLRCKQIGTAKTKQSKIVCEIFQINKNSIFSFLALIWSIIKITKTYKGLFNLLTRSL